MIAENEIVLTYLLQLMAERGILDKLAFKGGTCLRKMFIGSGGRFSTDLDFTLVEEHDHEDVILTMMEAFEQPFHGIQFGVPDDSYYETQDGLSWGVSPVYAHDWNPGGQSQIRLQVSRREVPTLPPSRNAQSVQSYFRHLPFDPADITCLTLPEIIAEKIRACYQRSKARDIYDLSVFAMRPLDHLQHNVRQRVRIHVDGRPLQPHPVRVQVQHLVGLHQPAPAARGVHPHQVPRAEAGDPRSIANCADLIVRFRDGPSC